MSSVITIRQPLTIRGIDCYFGNVIIKQTISKIKNIYCYLISYNRQVDHIFIRYNIRQKRRKIALSNLININTFVKLYRQSLSRCWPQKGVSLDLIIKTLCSHLPLLTELAMTCTTAFWLLRQRYRVLFSRRFGVAVLSSTLLVALSL